MTVNLPCECDAEEHEIEVSAEYSAMWHSTGLYAPAVGDVLPCGRVLNRNDLTEIVKRLDEQGIDEGD